MPLRPGRFLKFAWLALACLWCLAAAGAQRPAGMDAHYETHWFAHDGGPADVGAIAQAADGYLWLGSSRGLLRFDGVRFEPFGSLAQGGDQLQSPYVSWLYAEPDGGLWIGYAFGGVSHLSGGRLTHFGKAQGLPASTIAGILRDRAGVLWVSTVNRLYRLEGERFARLPASWGLPEGSFRLVEDGDGSLWVSNESGVYRRGPGEQRFDRIEMASGDPASGPQLARDPSGRVWAANGSGAKTMLVPLPFAHEGVRPDPGRWRHLPDVTSIAFGRDGALWTASVDGVRRVDPRTPQAGLPQLSDSATRPAVVFVDREGTAWVGASNGLLSYRATPLRRFPLPATESAEILAATGSNAIVATVGSGTLSTIASDGTSVALADAAKAGDVDALHRAPDGSIWTAGKSGVGHLHDGRLEMLPLPTLPGTSYQGVTSFATDDQGEPWISLQSVGAFQHSHGRWVRNGELLHLPKELIFDMATDAQRRLWLTYADGRVRRLDHASSPSLVAIEGLHTGGSPVVGFGPAGTWIVGTSGVALVDATGVHDLAGYTPSSQPSGVLEWGNGDLWINAQSEVVRIPKDELDRGLKDAGHATAVQRLDYLDGLVSTPSVSGEFPNMAATPDGRLWVARQEALLTLEPDRLRRNPVAPPVTLEWLSADGARHATTQAIDLPPGTREVRIGYTGLSLAIPGRVRFSHELQGQEAQWSAPTAARDVGYTNLRPGRYVFRVKAANEDGVWNETPAVLEFRILPHFWETDGFKALVVLALASMAWFVHRWRMRIAERRMRDVIEARLAERRHIARDLHDTLFQSTHALAMKVQVLAERLPGDDPARRAMANVLEVVDAVMAEGRQTVDDLRSDTTPDHLARALESAFRRVATPGGAPEFRCTVVGPARDLRDDAWRECLMIGSEAITNAVRHAAAAAVTVRIEHGDRTFRIEVRDDGSGFVVPAPGSEARAGRWGLVGMRERAQGLGMDLSVESGAGTGTRVALAVPAARAYRTSAPSTPNAVIRLWRRIRR